MSGSKLEDSANSLAAPVRFVAEGELTDVVALPSVQAAFVPASQGAAWQDELQEAVESGAFHLARTELVGVDIDTVATWLDRTLPSEPISRETRDALLSDILALFHLQEAVTAAAAYRLRIFTDTSNRRCGFHVDTVPPGAPVWGLFRVYNGAGTDWVDPNDVKSMDAFYAWLQKRDRVVRKYCDDPAERDARLESLDDRPAFLVDGAAIECVASNTTVVFRHLDASHHWSDHAPGLAWIHSSPMTGRPRLVVNISATRAGAR